MTDIFQLLFRFWAAVLNLLETPVITVNGVSASYLHIVIALFVITWLCSLFYRAPKA